MTSRLEVRMTASVWRMCDDGDELLEAEFETRGLDSYIDPVSRGYILRDAMEVAISDAVRKMSR